MVSDIRYLYQEEVANVSCPRLMRFVCVCCCSQRNQLSVSGVNNAGLGSSTNSLNNDDEALPPGWAVSVAPNGRVFYIDHNTKLTSWVSASEKR